MTISIPQELPRIQAWVRENGLDPDFSEKYPDHDALHVVFGVPTRAEGVVLTMELAVSAGHLPDSDRFVDMCIMHNIAEDRYTLEEAHTWWERFADAWPVTIERG